MTQTAELKLTDPTAGIEPLLNKAPTFTVDGREYTMRRLGVMDAMTALRIVATGLSGAARQGASLSLDSESFGIAVVTAMMTAPDQVVSFLANVVGLTNDEFQDPDVFPVSGLPVLIGALSEHPDMEALITNLKGLMNRPGFKTMVRTTSARG